MAAELKTVAEQLVNLSVKQVNELVQILKTDYGIEPAAAPAAMVVAGGGAEPGEGEAEKNSFDVVLKSAGQAKLAVVKLVKDVAGLGLKEAKELVDAAPKTLKEGLPKEEAESLKGKLEEAGAEIELK